MPKSTESLLAAITSLMRAEDPLAQRVCLVSHPDELLAPEADTVLGQIAGDPARASEAVGANRARKLLSRARQEGVIKLLFELAPVPQEIVVHVNRYLSAGPWHRVFFELREHASILTTPAADLYMEDLLTDLRQHGDQAARARVETARRLSEVARADGVEGAQSWLRTQLTRYFQSPPNVRLDAVASFLALSPPVLAGWAEMLKMYLRDVLSQPLPHGSLAIESAIQLLTEDLPASLRADAPLSWAEVQLALGQLYLSRPQKERENNVTLALNALNGVLATISADQDKHLLARAHHLLGWACAAQNTEIRVPTLQRAVSHLVIAAQEFETSGQPNDLADAVSRLAECLIEIADHTFGEDERKAALRQAMQHVEKTLQLALRPPMKARLQLVLARAYLAYAEFEPAFVPQALDLAESGIAATPQSDGYYWALCRARYAEMVIRLRERGAVGVDLGSAITRAADAVSSFAQQSLNGEEMYAGELLGDLHLFDHTWDAARVAYERVLILGEESFSESFTVMGEEAAATRESMVAAKLGYCLCRLGRPSEAVLITEKTKTRVILESIEWEDLIASDLPLETRRRLREALVEVRSLEAEARSPIDSANRRPENVLGEMLSNSRSRLAQLTVAASKVSKSYRSFQLTERHVLSLVPPSGKLVVPMISPVGTALIMVPSDASSIKTEHVCYTSLTLDQLKTLVGAYVLFLMTLRKDRADAARRLAQLTHQMWDKVMAGIATELAACGARAGSPVVLVNQAGLGVLPLQAAQDAVLPERVFVKEYSLTCIPSISLMAYCRSRPPRAQQTRRRLLTVVDPGDNLPYARLEAECVGRCVRRSELTTLVGSEATVTKVSAAGAGATQVHFACHAHFDIANPWQSGLTLADGILDAGDLAFSEEPHASQLITLSACETGVTNVRRSPNEYGGLPGAFLISGAQAVVSTLWSVNDVSAAILISDFYRRYLIEGKQVAVALREAQLWLRSATTADLLRWTRLQLLHYRALYPSSWGAVRTLLRLRHSLRQLDQKQPFEAPQHWAPFVALVLESGDRASLAPW
jgi:CHAT domain-containing protein/tetratricopeptide (TPR) repeat protein